MELNEFEISIVEEICRANQATQGYLADQIPYLRVRSREYTGVGLYVNFDVLPEYRVPAEKTDLDVLLGSQSELLVPGISYLAYVLDITCGKIHFLEVVTAGDEGWDGDATGFRFSR